MMQLCYAILNNVAEPRHFYAAPALGTNVMERRLLARCISKVSATSVVDPNPVRSVPFSRIRIRKF
jgi:hypothetical protein